MKRILIIKHGAFGDLIHATSAFRALRQFYCKDWLVLLTDPKFASLTSSMPYFNEIFYDERAASVSSFLKIRSFLRKGQFDFIYDLQVTRRTNGYYRLFSPYSPPLWSGSAPGCSHYIGNPCFNTVHVQDRFKRQLIQAGVIKQESEDLGPDLSWLEGETLPFNVKVPFIIMVPGSSKSHPLKRWPVSSYGELALRCVRKGYQIIVIGGEQEKEVLESLGALHPRILVPDRLLRVRQLATLGRQACLAVGNDTGPSHLLAAVGCPMVYCWSGASPPEIFAPRGSHVTICFKDNLEQLTADFVWETLSL